MVASSTINQRSWVRIPKNKHFSQRFLVKLYLLHNHKSRHKPFFFSSKFWFNQSHRNRWWRAQTFRFIHTAEIAPTFFSVFRGMVIYNFSHAKKIGCRKLCTVSIKSVTRARYMARRKLHRAVVCLIWRFEGKKTN